MLMLMLNTQVRNDFNEPFEIWLMYFVTRG